MTGERDVTARPGQAAVTVRFLPFLLIDDWVGGDPGGDSVTVTAVPGLGRVRATLGAMRVFAPFLSGGAA